MVFLKRSYALEITCAVCLTCIPQPCTLCPWHPNCLSLLSCPPSILIVCFRVGLGFCIINMLQQWFQGRRWQTSLRKSFPPSLWKTVRVAWQQIRLCQKYQQFKLTWKDALGKENQFQFPIKVLGKNRRSRIYLCGQSNDLGAAQPSSWTSELPVTYTERPAPSGHFRVSTGCGPKITQKIEAHLY